MARTLHRHFQGRYTPTRSEPDRDRSEAAQEVLPPGDLLDWDSEAERGVAAEHRDDAIDVDQVDAYLVPAHYSTVTDLARFRGWSTSVPRATATS